MKAQFSIIPRKLSSLKRKCLALFVDPSFPKVHEGICLHIGCGTIDLPGWINIDARPLPHVHIVTKDLSLSEFKNESVSAIYLCHVLEHFPFSELQSVLKLFHQKLQPGGVLYLAVPDFSKIVETYVATHDISSIIKPLMGGQEYEFNFHYTVFDCDYLTLNLLSSGFISTTSFDPTELLGKHFQDFSLHPLSLNLKAIK
ncbi:methyltransferase domain-containing protein [bacterium]|nr:methyltransferase domain-containing protein [bacterium]